MPVNCLAKVELMCKRDVLVFFSYHLQAFRHLYVLAIERRIVIPRDVDTQQACYVELELVSKVICLLHPGANDHGYTH